MMGELPLSDVQMLMATHEAVARRPIYNMPMCFRVRGPLDVAALERSLRAVIGRHAALRSYYHGLTAASADAGSFALRQLPYRPSSSDAWQMFGDIFEPSFDLTSELPIRCAVVSVGDEWWIGMCVHHIAGDSWSLGLLVDDLSAHYRAGVSSSGPSPALPSSDFFADYAVWEGEQRWHTGWWSDYLAGLPPATLPGRTGPVSRSTELGRLMVVDLRLTSRHTRALRRLSRRRRVSVAASLAAWIGSTSRLDRTTEELVLGVATVVRSAPALQYTIGPLLNTVPVRLRPDERGSTGSGEALAAVVAHADVPASRIYAAARRGAAGPADAHLLTQVLNVETQQVRLRLPGAQVTAVPVHPRWAVYPLVWDFEVPTIGTIHGTVRMAADLFDDRDGDQLVASFHRQAAMVLED